MSDSETTSSPEPVPAEPALPALRPEPVSAPAARPRRTVWPYPLLALIVLIGAGEGYLWYRLQAEAANATQLAVLQAQVNDLRQLAMQTRPGSGSVAAQADLSVKLATVAAQLNAVQSQMAADHGALTLLQSNSLDLTKLAARIELLNQLETARMALDAGQPLGTIANAPPALSNFATTPPPTEAALRLGFPAAARAAEAASVAGDTKGGAWAHALARLENFVTVSAGLACPGRRARCGGDRPGPHAARCRRPRRRGGAAEHAQRDHAAGNGRLARPGAGAAGGTRRTGEHGGAGLSHVARG